MNSVGPLEPRQVPCSFEHDFARAGDLGSEPVGDRAEVGQVRGADEDEGRRCDLAEALGRRRLDPLNRPRLRLAPIGCELDLERVPLHRADPPAHAGLDVSEPGAQVELDRLVDVAGVEELVLLGSEALELG